MIPPHELSTVELLRMVRRAATDTYREALELELADDTLAWELAGDGTWRKAPASNGVNTQELMQRAAPGIAK